MRCKLDDGPCETAGKLVGLLVGRLWGQAGTYVFCVFQYVRKSKGTNARDHAVSGYARSDVETAAATVAVGGVVASTMSRLALISFERLAHASHAVHVEGSAYTN